jgi:tetratricopeptide (TPR) repeat protein
MKHAYVLILTSGTLFAVSFVGWILQRNTIYSGTTEVFYALSVPLPSEIAGNHFALGEYYFNQPPYDLGSYDLEKAEHHYQQSILETIGGSQSAPLHAWYQLARVDFVQNKLTGAIAKLQEQLNLYGDAVPQAYYMLGLSYGYLGLETDDPEDWKRAEDNFIKFMEYAPQSPWPKVDLAWVYFSQGKYEDMIPVLEAGLAANNDQAWLLNAYGLALFNLGETEAARQALLRAQQSYKTLSVDDWRVAYLDSHPGTWDRGFSEFGEMIEYNLQLTTRKE